MRDIAEGPLRWPRWPLARWERPRAFADRDATSLEHCCERVAGQGPSSGASLELSLWAREKRPAVRNSQCHRDC